MLIESVLAAPFTFWIAAGVLVLLVVEAIEKWHSIWAKPALTVYGTVGVWYLGDYLLTAHGEFQSFPQHIVELGFGQVAAFLLIVRALAPPLANHLCRRWPSACEKVMVSNRTLGQATGQLALLWLVLFVVAGTMRRGEWLPMLWPPAERYKVAMFQHSGIGGGADFLLAAAAYIHLLVCALFGPLAVLSRGSVRLFAMAMMAVSWPYFFFDRTRNVMLAVLLPTVACYWTFGRQRIATKIAVSLLLLAFVGFWFQLVMAYRDAGMRDMSAFLSANSKTSGVQGLDMMKELCWIDALMEGGEYKANLGERYFAEAVNFIPRTFWAGKPMPGWDYAIARGFGRTDGLVNATIATGMIGQGVTNFGPYFGVAAAAALMAVWIAVLARLWVQRASVARNFLYALGLGLTFNMGRDVTLLVLFPFVFGYIGVRLIESLKVDEKGARARPLHGRA